MEAEMCNCLTWCRTPEMFSEVTHGFKYPIPEHHPRCEDFKQEQFTRLEYEGTFCVMETKEAEAMLAEEKDCEYEVSVIMLTRDQFNSMPEFNGF